jgi:23S rRNA U2552 (ribose-2'-O)-methylase RlmE/FtsJ
MNYLYINKKEDINEDIKIENIELKWKDKKQSLLYKKFYEDISNEKEQINKLNNNEIWDKMKKVGNPYELIYTTYHRKRKNDSISKYIPLSRSYFKMWEIYHNYPIFKYFPLNTKFHLSHLAEGPGGFMEASYNYLYYLRMNHYNQSQLNQLMNNDVYEGITLKPHNDHVPDWTKIKKIFGGENNVCVNYGNLYVYDDVLEYVNKFENEKAHIVTADGGFDYSADFNGQELSSCQIIYSEIVIALKILMEKGTFICKVFDLFSVTMIRMIELLNRNFEYVYIYKPETSRPANSEKYIICMNFLNKMSDGDKDKLLYQIKMWNDMVNENDENYKNSCFIDIDKIKVGSQLISSLDKYNREYLENQKRSLRKTIEIAKNNPSSIIDKDEYETILKTQVQNAYNWCIKYNIPINTESIYWKKHGLLIKK